MFIAFRCQHVHAGRVLHGGIAISFFFKRAVMCTFIAKPVSCSRFDGQQYIMKMIPHFFKSWRIVWVGAMWIVVFSGE